MYFVERQRVDEQGGATDEACRRLRVHLAMQDRHSARPLVALDAPDRQSLGYTHFLQSKQKRVIKCVDSDGHTRHLQRETRPGAAAATFARRSRSRSRTSFLATSGSRATSSSPVVR